MIIYYLSNDSISWGRTSKFDWTQEMGTVAEPITTTVRIRGTITHFPVAVRNPALDIVLNGRPITTHEIGRGILPLSIIIGGDIGVDKVASPILLTISVDGEWIPDSMLSTDSVISLTISLLNADIITEVGKNNWIRWSNIGSLDFTIGKDNVAGERPLDWRGWVYAIMKLRNNIVAYGQNGVSLLTPSSTTFGLTTLSKIGLKGKCAVCGNDFVHFFLRSDGKLCKIEEGIEVLDYQEYLSTLLDSVTMSYDELNNLVYICDGILGYVYSVKDKSLGEGPSNITGIGYQNEELYVTAPTDIVTPAFEICTDIYDMGSRKNKTIHSIELGTDATGDLWVSVDYRLDKSVDFTSLSWHKVSSNGVTVFPCYGVEFRIKVKKITYTYFELDYIRVNGIVHDYNFLYPYVGR